MMILNRLNSEVVAEQPAIKRLSVRSQDVPVSVPGILRVREDSAWGLQTDLAEGITWTWDQVCPLSESWVGS